MSETYHLEAQRISIETEAAIRRGNWAVVLGLYPFRDGDMWCVLMGSDLQSGLGAFGETPDHAMREFHHAFQTKSARLDPEAKP